MPITLIITVLLFILAICFKKSKVLFALQIIWITIMAGFNTNAADFQNNYNTYIAANNRDKWWNLYTWLATYFKEKMIDYVHFNFFLVCIGMILMAITIVRMTKYPNLVISMYYIFPFIDNIIQKRGFYAVAVLTYALYFLLKEKNKFNYVIYMFLVFVAFQFHASALLLFTVPFFMMIPLKIERNIALVSVLFCSILSGVISKVATAVLPTSLQEKNTLYFSTLANSASLVHTLVWIVWQLSFLLLIYYIYRRKESIDHIDDVMIRLNLWGTILVLFYAYDPVFTRVFRPILILDLIYVVNTLNYKDRKNRLTILGMFGVCGISFILFDLMSQWGFDYMVLQIFENNLMFN